MPPETDEPAPRAAQRNHAVAAPQGERVDPFYWLRDDERVDPDVLAYLRAESAYQERTMAHLKPLEDALYGEIIARLKQDDSSVPYRKAGFWYYTRFETGREYPLFVRRRGTMDAAEELLLDGNERAIGRDFYELGNLEVSPDGEWLAFCEDTVGRREYRLQFKHLSSGEVLAEAIGNVETDIAWTNDNLTVLYVAKDPETLLGIYVRQHVLRTDPARDRLIFEQKDRQFYTGVAKSKSERFIFISMETTVASEWHYADADASELRFEVFLPAEPAHEYQIEHCGDRFVIRTNWQARNFRLMTAPVGAPVGRDEWRELLAHQDDTLIEDFDVFSEFLAVSLRSGAQLRIGVKPWLPADAPMVIVEGHEAPCAMSLATNPELDTPLIRYAYSSLTAPTATFDYDTVTGTATLLKRDPIEGNFNSDDYGTELLWATARDGARVPVSIVYRRDARRAGPAPLLQYAYGAYGLSMDPVFSSPRLSLLDRGFVYAIAHVRGGQELGRAWYDGGRLLHKKNTFADFIDVTKFLVTAGVAAPDAVFAMGGSAGGLLMGVVVNWGASLYRGIVAQVPFVDVVTTMLDDSIPLTTNEYEEWGDPADPLFYDYMLSYSPYDNLQPQDYPAMLVTTGLWDSQVQYYEPAKWVAKLRTLKTDANPLLLHVDMEAGHGGKSGRFQRYREIALEYAFILGEIGTRR